MKSLIVIYSKVRGVLTSQGAQRAFMFWFMFMGCVVVACASGSNPGVGAIDKVAGQIEAYLPSVRGLLYAIAGVVALTGAISVYIKMNNEEQDVKKSIMLVIGACIFLVAAAEALPLFFGLS